MKRWGFTYKTNLVWYKVRQDGGSVWQSALAYYFRNVTEMVLFGSLVVLYEPLRQARRQVTASSSR